MFVDLMCLWSFEYSASNEFQQLIALMKLYSKKSWKLTQDPICNKFISY